jgi:hypothetical protein
VVKRKRKLPIDLSPEAQDARIEAFVKGMAESDAMEARGRYLAQGRQLETLSRDDLMARWAQAMRDLATRTVRDAQELNDTSSELQLRNIEPEMSLIEDVVEVVRRDFEQSQIENPEGDPAIRAAIADYMRRLNDEIN